MMKVRAAWRRAEIEPHNSRVSKFSFYTMKEGSGWLMRRLHLVPDRNTRFPNISLVVYDMSLANRLLGHNRK